MSSGSVIAKLVLCCVSLKCCPFLSSLFWISAFSENGFLKASALPVEDGGKRQDCKNEAVS